jgi:hypothetical protein
LTTSPIAWQRLQYKVCHLYVHIVEIVLDVDRNAVEGAQPSYVDIREKQFSADGYSR